MALMTHILVFRSMKRLGVLLFPLDGMLESINVVQTFESVNKTLVCDHSNEIY